MDQQTFKKNKKILVLISGRGSNFQALHAYQLNHKDAGYEIIGLGYDIKLSAKPAGLDYAKNNGIPIIALPYDKGKVIAEELLKSYVVTNNGLVDGLVLAGFMRILSPEFIVWAKNFFLPIFNIHPALLPDYKGLDTHERAWQDYQILIKNNPQQKFWHGATVHLVNAAIDGGKILAQEKILLQPNDTVTDIAKKILQLEHQLYPKVISNWAKGAIASL